MGLLPAFYTVLLGGAAPLPKPFLDALESIEVDTSVDKASRFTLTFALSRTAIGDWDVTMLNPFRPLLPVQIRVHLGFGISETIINGYVESARIDNRSEPGASTFHVTGLDVTGTLMGMQDILRPWPNTPDFVIASQVFASYGVIPAPAPTPLTRTELQGTQIQRTTDIRFLKRIAKKNGYEVFVTPDPLIGRDIGMFRPPLLMVPPQGVLSVDFGLATNMDRFEVTYAMLQPKSVLALAMDEFTKMPVPAPAVVALEPPMGLEPTLLRVLPMPPISRPAGTTAASPAELITTAQSVASRSSRALKGTGEVDGLRFGRVLRPGLPVAVRGAGREYSGVYYVTDVSHQLSTSGYTQSFEGWRNALGLNGTELFIDPLAAVT